MKKYEKTMLLFTILIYIYFLLSIIIFKSVSPLELLSGARGGIARYNLTLFKDIYNSNLKFTQTALIGNIILFVPMGLYFTMKNNAFIRNIFLGFLISLLFESFQFIFKIGVFDVNDLFLNTVGAIIGIVIYKFMLIFLKRKTLNKLIVFTGFFAAIILLILEMLLLWYN